VVELELGLFSREEPKFFMAISANFWRRELGLSGVKNPSFSWRLFFLVRLEKEWLRLNLIAFFFF
jgi:hypothetical protein